MMTQEKSGEAAAPQITDETRMQVSFDSPVLPETVECVGKVPAHIRSICELTEYCSANFKTMVALTIDFDTLQTSYFGTRSAHVLYVPADPNKKVRERVGPKLVRMNVARIYAWMPHLDLNERLGKLL